MDLRVLMQNVKKIRLLKNFTMRYISDVIVCDQSAYSRWESGESEPKLSHFLKIADLFEMSLDEIAEFNPDNPHIPNPKEVFKLKMANYEQRLKEYDSKISMLEEQKVLLEKETDLLNETLQAKTRVTELLEEKVRNISGETDSPYFGARTG